MLAAVEVEKIVQILGIFWRWIYWKIKYVVWEKEIWGLSSWKIGWPLTGMGKDTDFGTVFGSSVLDVGCKWPFDIQVEMSKKQLNVVSGAFWEEDVNMGVVSV